MLPLEVVFGLLLVIWGLVGLVRGFAQEIGSTIAIVLGMTILRTFGPMIIGFFNKFAGKLVSMSIPVAQSVPAGTNPFCASASQQQFMFYALIFVAIVFMGYAGDTFSIRQKVGGMAGNILGLFVGLVNGYLIFGDLWYFLQRCANNAVPALGIKSVGTLSTNATTLSHILPFNLVQEPLLWLGILFLLLILRIAK
jgi:uncharacterized membrane protein required for colicin V production